MSVSIIASLSVDGFIASKEAQTSTDWTSPEDTKFFKQKTKEAGVVIMGRTTYETIPDNYRPLKDRLNIVYTSSSDSDDTLSKSSLSSRTDLAKVMSQTSPGSPLTDTMYTKLDPKTVINLLQPTFPNIAITGGTSIYTQFMQAGVVDTVYLTVEPILFGTGTPLFDKPLMQRVQLEKVEDLNPNTLLITYSIHK